MKTSNDENACRRPREYSNDHNTELRLAIELGDRIVCHSYPLSPTPSWQHFEQFLCTKLGLNSISVKYRDEEGDEVSLGSQEEFSDILKVYNKLASVLLLHVEPVETDLPTGLSILNLDSAVKSGSGLVDADGFPTQTAENNTRGEGWPASPSFTDEELAKIVFPNDNLRALNLTSFSTAGAKLPELGAVNRPVASTSAFADSATDQYMDYVVQTGLGCRPKEPQTPPEWFTNFMEKFKGDVTLEITKRVMHRMQKLMIRTAFGPVTMKNDSEAGNTFSGFHIESKPDGGDLLLPPSAPPPSTSNFKPSEIVHPGVVCDNCGRNIIGVRYKCGNCIKFDLCDKCEALKGVHETDHAFVKMRYPSTAAGTRKKTGKTAPLLKHILYDYDADHERHDAVVNDRDKVLLKTSKKGLRDEVALCIPKRDANLGPHDLVYASREKKLLKRLERQALKLEKYREKHRPRFGDRSPDQLFSGMMGNDNAGGYIIRHHHGHRHPHVGMAAGNVEHAHCSGRYGRADLTDASNSGDAEKSSDDSTMQDRPWIGFNPFTVDLVGAKFLFDETIPDGSVVAPGTLFTKKWRILNTGNRPWTTDTLLKCVESDGLQPCPMESPVPLLRPNEEGVMSIDMIAPAIPGSYTSHWRLTHQNQPFGHKMWCSVVVAHPVQLSKAAISSDNYQRSQEIIANGEENRPDIQPDMVSDENLHLVNQEPENGEQVPDILRAGRMTEENSKLGTLKMSGATQNNGDLPGANKNICFDDLLFSSMVPRCGTATPNNTLLDLAAPKSSVGEDLTLEDADDIGNCEASTCILDNEDDDKDVSFLSEDSEFGGSMISLSSTESDLGYVMVPLPACFNFTVPPTICSPTLLHCEDDDSKSCDHENNSDCKEQAEKHGECDSNAAASSQTADNKEENSSVTTTTDSDEDNVTAQGKSPTVVFGKRHVLVDNLNAEAPDVTAVASNTDEERTESVHEICRSPPSPPPPPNIPFMTITPQLPTEKEEGNNYKHAPDVVCPERILPTLPENLMSAAATIFNSARGILTDIHKASSTPELPTPTHLQQLVVDSQPTAASCPSTSLILMTQLTEMGFYDRQRNAALLDKYNGDMTRVVADLLQEVDNNWHDHRH